MAQGLIPLSMAIALAVACMLSGCAKSQRPASSKPPPRVDEKPVWPAIDAGRFRQQFARLGTLPNTGLQLPVASPDGRWLATLSSSSASSLDPDAIFTARTIAQITLALCDLAKPQSAPRTISAGAAWPVWTPDSRQLIAVGYDQAGHCALIIHDVATNQTWRMETGVAHVITPAISPSGRQVALAGFTDVPQQARLYVYDLPSQQLKPLPLPKDVVWQVLPMWIGEQALLCYARTADQTGVMGVSTDGGKPAAMLMKLPLPTDAADAVRSQAGIAQPLGPGAQRLARYDTAVNQIVLHNLGDGRGLPLDSGSQAGCWGGGGDDPRFISATEKQLAAYTTAGSRRVLAGQAFLPLWCHPGGSSFLLLSPGQQPWSFELLKMQITPTP